MVRLHLILLFLLAIVPASAQSTNAPPPKALPVNSSAKPTPPRAQPVDAATAAAAAAGTNAAPTPVVINPAAPAPNARGVDIRWYGHGFVYLTSSAGLRCAIDPFGPNIVHYKFPEHLASDFVLVTHEAEDHSATENIFGNPLIFRSVMAVGLNRANGIPFYGVALQKDPVTHGAANTSFTLSFDGIKFAYIGQIAMPLISQEKVEFGKVDVVFLPVGLATLNVAELNQVVKDIGAKIVIPINYKTDESGDLQLRSLSDYLSATKFPVRHFDTSEIALNLQSIPNEPTVFVLKSP